jgi:hypothetical protein
MCGRGRQRGPRGRSRPWSNAGPGERPRAAVSCPSRSRTARYATRPNRSAARARRRSASTSRSRGGADVTSSLRSCSVALATAATACSNAASLAREGSACRSPCARTEWRQSGPRPAWSALTVVQGANVPTHAASVRVRRRRPRTRAGEWSSVEVFQTPLNPWTTGTIARVSRTLCASPLLPCRAEALD